MRDHGARVRREIGVHLRRMRSSLGWTLEEVSEKASLSGIPVSASTVSRVERGLTSVPAEALSALCDSLGTSLAYIEEIVRSAARQEDIDLTGWDDERLMERAQDAARAGEVRRALAYLEATHDWLCLQDDGVDRTARMAEVLIWEAACYRRLHSFSRALDAVGRVLNLRGAPKEAELHAVLFHVEVGYITGDFYRARVFAEHAATLFPQAPEAVRARGEMVLGMLSFEQDEFEEAIPRLEAARTLYGEQEVEIEALRASVTLGYCHFALGRRQGGRRMVRDARARADKNGYGELLVYAQTTEGRLSAQSGEIELAEEQLKSAAFLARKLELATQEFISWYHLWRSFRDHDLRDAAERQARRMRRLLRRVTPQVPEVKDFLAFEESRAQRDRRAER